MATDGAQPQILVSENPADAQEQFDMRYVPAPVAAALCFVKNCNENMGLRFFDGPRNQVKCLTAELHPAQEGAFRMANILIGDYFAGFFSDRVVSAAEGAEHDGRELAGSELSGSGFGGQRGDSGCA